MPFNQSSNGFKVQLRSTINWASNVIIWLGRSLKVKVLLSEYLLPIRLKREFSDIPRKRSCIKKTLREVYGDDDEYHKPTRLDGFMYGLSLLSPALLKFCLTWTTIQFLFAVLNTAIAEKSPQSNIDLIIATIFKLDNYPWAIISILILINIIVLLLLIVVAMSNVAFYGPTSACFVIAFQLRDRTGSIYRLARNSYPRAQHENEVQLKLGVKNYSLSLSGTMDRNEIWYKLWIDTKLKVKLVARTEAREKLINIIVAVVTIILCLSIISYLLTSPDVGMPLIQYNFVPVKMQDGIWMHLHFYLVTLATIGYGDMTFANTTLGHIMGAFMSIFVLAAVLGFVSYINYFIINFREKVLAGLNLEVGADGADWIAKSLKDI